jgi:hypothetical protein
MMWVVRCVKFVPEEMSVATVFGPFYDRGDVDNFIRKHSDDFDILESVELSPAIPSKGDT